MYLDATEVLTSVSELAALQSPPEKVVVVRHDGKIEELPVPEQLQDLIGRIYGGVAESMDRVSCAGKHVTTAGREE